MLAGQLVSWRWGCSAGGIPWSETGMLGNFGVASRVPSSISNFKMERGTSLETLAGKGLILHNGLGYAPSL